MEVSYTLPEALRALGSVFQYPRDASLHYPLGNGLRSEAIQAQSANVDIVSGATFTSEAYAESLNAALQQAHLA